MRKIFFALIALALALPVSAEGQEGEARSIAGRVVRPAGDGVAGVPAIWVVLHRVGRDTAGALDSMRTRSNGSYSFDYRATGDTNAVYFVSATRGGVAYFTVPQRTRRISDEDAEILVYDTTSAEVPVTVRGHHIIVTAPDTADSSIRAIIEVFQLSNDSTVTRVASGEDGFTFSAPLPVGVTQVRAGDGDVSSDALKVEDGRLYLGAPLPPGTKQFSVIYDLPANNTVLDFDIETAADVVEVLVEDPRGIVRGAGLTEVNFVQVEGRPFKRFLAQPVEADERITVTVPGATEERGRLRLLFIVAAIGAALLLGFGMAVMRRGPAAMTRRKEDQPESLAMAIADLDASFEKLASPTDAQRSEHYVKRARLKGRLNAALAKRDGLT